MGNRLSQLLISFRSTIRGVDTTRQMAIGVTLGMLLGMMPKDTAFVLLFAVMLLLSQGNLLAGAVSAILFSWVGWLLEPATHAAGLAVLSIEALQPWLAEIQGWPLGPWFRLDNTVVMGSLMVGLVGVLPCYRISYVLLDRHRESLIWILTRNPLSRWILDHSDSDLQEANL